MEETEKKISIDELTKLGLEKLQQINSLEKDDNNSIIEVYLDVNKFLQRVF